MGPTEALSKAKAAGATQIATTCYPPEWGKHRGDIFAFRYFNHQNDEVGYYIPDIQAWNEFSPPRKWSPEFLAKITLRPLHKEP